VVLAVLAGTYQPIRFGDFYGGDFPGLPHGTGLRSVNTFAGAAGEIYVPQQSGAFSVIPSIANNGPLAVTIEAVSILSPQQQADVGQGVAPFPSFPPGRCGGRSSTPARASLISPAGGPWPASPSRPTRGCLSGSRCR
jgi:hypothetical protein